MRFRSLEEFWPFYMNQHSKAATRRWHFFATGISTLFFLAALLVKWWLFIFAPLFGYGLAWYSHFFIEGNAPATFGHPLWSLMCDYKMFGLMLTGRLDREIKRLGKRPIFQDEDAAAEVRRTYWETLDQVEKSRRVLKNHNLSQPPNSVMYRREIP